MRSEAGMSKVRPQVISPSKPATFPTSIEPWNQTPTCKILLKRKEWSFLECKIRQREEEGYLKWTCFLGNQGPVASSMVGNMSKKFCIFFWCPKTPLNVWFIATRRPPHGWKWRGKERNDDYGDDGIEESCNGDVIEGLL